MKNCREKNSNREKESKARQHRVWLILLVLLMLASCLASCEDAPKTGTEPTEVSSSSGQAEITEKVEYKLPETFPSARDFELRVLTRNGTGNSWSIMDLTSEGFNDEIINDAVYTRNSALMAKYGFTIKQMTNAGDAVTMNNDIKAAVKANTDAYHVAVTDAFNSAGALTLEGCFIDLNTVPNLTLEEDFWNQRFNSQMSVGGKLFCTTGDLTVSYAEKAWLLLFNKELLEKYNLENPYELVNDGKWTIAKHNEMTKIANEDVNGDGVRKGTDDIFGLVIPPFHNYAMFFASGESIVAKDENDLPILTVYNSHSEEVVKTIQELLTDTNAVWFRDDSAGNGKIIARGGCLFGASQMTSVRGSRNFEFDFGILPMPKMSDDQEEYYSVVSSIASVYSVLSTNQNLAETGFILNALSYASADTLTPAYYEAIFEVTLRDAESEETLKAILDSASFDLSFMFNFGDWMNVLMRQMPTLNFASKYDELKDASNALIDEVVEKLGSLA